MEPHYFKVLNMPPKHSSLERLGFGLPALSSAKPRLQLYHLHLWTFDLQLLCSLEPLFTAMRSFECQLSSGQLRLGLQH